MTQNPQPPTHSLETVSPREALVARVDGLTNHILRSKQYELLRHEGYSHTDAFSSLAHHSAINKESRLSPTDRSILEATSQLGSFIAATEELRDLRIKRDYTGDDNQKDEIRALKRGHIVPFNHSLKGIVSTSPNLNIYAVAESLNTMYEKIFFREHSRQRLAGETTSSRAKLLLERSRQEIIDSLEGMRHEGAAEAMLAAQGVACISDVTAAQDISGIDILVSFDADKTSANDETSWSKAAADLGVHGWLELDIATSRNGAAQKRRRRPLSMAVSTGLTDEDFTGTKSVGGNLLGISYDTAVAKGAPFVENILQVAYEVNQARDRVRKSIGAQSAQRSQA